MSEFLQDTIRGLSAAPKRTSSKFLYDAAGSELFERICETEEYYLTRAELEILRTRGRELGSALGPAALILEPGSGSAAKTDLLLKSCEKPAGYVPVDVSPTALRKTQTRLRREHPTLDVAPVEADFCADFALPSLLVNRARSTTTFFCGSTFGNFEPAERTAFLRRLGAVSDLVLLGVDLVKDRFTLEAAYDDRMGWTARFNLNLLARMNRELGADVDLTAFRHRARYDEGRRRVEMHLESLRDQTVRVGIHRFDFQRGETIHTESSYKFTPAQIAEIASSAGLRLERYWTDGAERYGMFLLRVTSSARPASDSDIQPPALGA